LHGFPQTNISNILDILLSKFNARFDLVPDLRTRQAGSMKIILNNNSVFNQIWKSPATNPKALIQKLMLKKLAVKLLKC